MSGVHGQQYKDAIEAAGRAAHAELKEMLKDNKISFDFRHYPIAVSNFRVLRAAIDAYLSVFVTDTSAERLLSNEILSELNRARTKFPGSNVTFAALIEEVGELATATFEESQDRVREEAIQVAVMAMRMVLDGDNTFDTWRASKGLDQLNKIGPSRVNDLLPEDKLLGPQMRDIEETLNVSDVVNAAFTKPLTVTDMNEIAERLEKPIRYSGTSSEDSFEHFDPLYLEAATALRSVEALVLSERKASTEVINTLNDELNVLYTEALVLREAVRKAEQLGVVASDWNLNEVEIDGKMADIYYLTQEFRNALLSKKESWLDINTVPKDGTKVLLRLGSSRERIEIAYWYAPWNNWQVGTIPTAEEEYHGIGSAMPTAWKPLS